VRLCLSIEIQEGMSYADTLSMTRAGEALDYDSSLLAEHYYPSGVQERYTSQLMSADAWIYLAALARDTSKIRLGTLVSPVTFRHPSVLAKMAATLDHVSDGRAELGIGAGWFAGEHAAFGFQFPEAPRRVDLLEEQLQVITGLWTHDPFSYQGKHYQLTEAHFTPNVAKPPTLIVGGSATAERLPRLAARYADEYVITLPSVEQCRAVRQRLDQACERANRDPRDVSLSVFTPVCIAETEAAVKAIYERFAETNPQYRRMMNNETAWIMGTPDRVQDQLGELERARVERVMLSVNCDAHREMLPLVGAQGKTARSSR
jgi:alkanesulfonate monooxygenase SsuD/methylene tetrahydromethanopterin reductase-like flavin-dependent oxidoreductase (luciferase family)